MEDRTANFIATRVCYDIRDGAPEARLSTPAPDECYLVFQRRAPARGGDTLDREERNIYVEFPDPRHGGYDLVQHCLLERGRLVLTLDRPLNGKDEIVATIEVTDTAFERFLAGMRKVFSDKYHLLQLSDDLL